MDGKIKIAQIMGKWIGGGVESVIMNYFENMDRTKFQFDFICDEDSTNIPYEKIKKLGGKIIIVPPYQHIFKYISTLKKIFKKNNYQIVHSNINTISVFPLYAAKKTGIPIRIAHSHSSSNKVEWKKNLIKNILRIFSKKYANVYFACSESAGRYLFGNKTYENGKVTIINNAIDIEKFKFDLKKEKEIKDKNDIEDSAFVIGHIGRFVAQKNHSFLIDVFNEVHKIDREAILLLIGQGPLQSKIKRKVTDLKLEENVKFLGQISNISDYYNAMSTFVLPSIYEGLGMVLIEAQENKLPCIASTEVPIEASISNQVEYIDIEKGAEYWAQEILKKNRENIKYKYNENRKKYNIKNASKRLEKEYIKELNKI